MSRTAPQAGRVNSQSIHGPLDSLTPVAYDLMNDSRATLPSGAGRCGFDGTACRHLHTGAIYTS
jgi:hypothetical protein